MCGGPPWHSGRQQHDHGGVMIFLVSRCLGNGKTL
jgi:hypothetical protein